MKTWMSVLFSAVAAIAQGQHGGDHAGHAHGWTIEDVPMPAGVAPEIGAVAFGTDGELIIATRRSGIWTAEPVADPAAFDWRAFTEVSLHNPMGVAVLGRGDLLVAQMPELTRIRDTDGDGIADTFDSLCREWGVSGNYHETNAGPVPSGDGGWFVAVGTASHNGPTFRHTRGEFSATGRRGRNFSAVPWKGWVVKVTAEGGVIPWASGFRANNGIAVGPEGRLWVTDNQGDWRGTSPIFHVEQGGFYGHPSSLVWRPDHPGDDPLRYPLEELERMRTRPAVQLPHGKVCNSPSEPIFDTTGGAFGPFEGQMFVGDIAGPRILRVMLEEVDGVMQGAVVPFTNGGRMRGGTNRLCFSPDGRTLWAGQTYRGWGKPSEGLQRITFTGHAPQAIHTVSLTAEGFRIRFTQPIAPATVMDPAAWRVARFHYDYGHRYGSPERERTGVAVSGAVVEAGEPVVWLTLDERPQAGEIYEITCPALDGLGERTAWYTINTPRPR